MDKEYIYSSNDEPILTIEEQSIIVEWTRNNYKTFRSSGYNRQMQMFDYYAADYIPSCIWDIKKRIMDKEGLHGFKQEPMFRDAIGYMTDGGQLQEHTDPNPKFSNLIHTRFNVYIQIPIKGGLPIYNNQLCSLNERTYICCRSGIDMHYCQKVEGPRERIMVTFGFLLPPERIQNIKYLY
jgi:hypothetical protein